MQFLSLGFLSVSILPIALGRKNFLFAGSKRGAERAAMFYSFFGTCKKNDVNPFEWLKKVLEVIPEYKVNKLHELLPQNLQLYKYQHKPKKNNIQKSSMSYFVVWIQKTAILEF